MNKNCKQCLYFGKCCADEVCDDYTPTCDDVDEIIKSARLEFHKEWFQYIEEFNN